MTEERYKRQSGLINQDDLASCRIVLVGAGGIGGITAILLTKMGCDNLHVYDFDEIEEHNVGNQVYGPGHIGDSKVSALKEVVELLDDKVISVYNEKFDTAGGDILIFAVDSIEIREELYNKNKDRFAHIIDLRMAAQLAQWFIVDMSNEEDVKKYEQTFYTDPIDVPCTERATIYCSGVIGGFATAGVKHIVAGEKPPFSGYIDMVNMTVS